MENSLIEFEMIKTIHLIKRVIDNQISLNVGKDLTVSQAHLIGYITNHSTNSDVYQKDIEKAFELHRSSVSLMLNNMEKLGYIKRIDVEKDARLKKIVLTPKADALQNKIESIVKSFNNQLMDGISEEEQVHFLKTLNKIKINTKNKMMR